MSGNGSGPTPSTSAGAAASSGSLDSNRNRTASVAVQCNSATAADDYDDSYDPYPKPDDEPRHTCKLFGNSFSRFVELSGWSSFIPLKFFNIQDSTRFREMKIDAKGQVDPPAAAKYWNDGVSSLREMTQMIGSQQRPMNPIYVQVVARKKVDTIVLNKTVFIVSTLVVADESGYCLLCSMNEGFVTVYNGVEVGDFLLISLVDKLSVPKRDHHRGLFAGGSCLNLEIKVQFHSVRRHYIHKFDMNRVSQFKMEEQLFAQLCTLRLPNELENTRSPPVPVPNQAVSDPDPPSKYFDVLGVLTYVGRIQRFKIKHEDNIQNDKFETLKVSRFILYRWIKLVDRQSKKAIPLKIFIYNSTMDSQSSLVPGAIVLLTFCQLYSDNHAGMTYVSSTDFSEVYTGKALCKYFAIRSKPFTDKGVEVISRLNYLEILKRTDIQLSLGGTLPIRIESREIFLNSYQANYDYFLQRNIPSIDNPITRRESRFLYVPGTIMRILKIVGVEDSLVSNVTYMHKEYGPELQKQALEQKAKLISFNYLRFAMGDRLWFTYMRKLPPFNPNHLNGAKTSEIESKIVAEYEDFCKPLLVPAVVPLIPMKRVPKMAKMEKADGPPYLILDILDRKKSNWVTSLWRPTEGCSFEEMEKRLMEVAKAGKRIVGFVEVVCIEEDSPLEINFNDFVVEEE